MAKIDDLRAEAQELGIELTGEEKAADIKKLIDAKREENGDDTGGNTTEQERSANALATFDFAVNSVKLNRAKAHVAKTQPELAGKALVDAVKARYVEIGGWLISDKPARRGKAGGRVVNMADDDGSGDE